MDLPIVNRIEFELERRLAEAENIGVGFTVSTSGIDPNAPNCSKCSKCSKISDQSVVELVLQL
jgi:hypothetical protein